jgi:fatty acid desaturase
MADDREMLRAASELARDLQRPNPVIYWSDLLGSTLFGYAALAGAMMSSWTSLAIVCGAGAVLALYRATLFIHEITHLDHVRLPGFRLVWNLLIGIPLMLPSFMYEHIHIIHHSRTRYGTIDDPEYLPLALMKPWTLPLLLFLSLLMPVALLLRFGVLGPLSLLSSRLRRTVIGRLSGLQINPRFERTRPAGDFARQWAWQEVAASLVAIALIAGLASQLLPLRILLIYLGVIAGIAVLNQVRTLVAHLWESDGAPLTVTAQYLDTTNVTKGFLPWLWAPVGLRFHALHHLLPSLPYHALGQVHRRISHALSPDSSYHRANYPSLYALLRKLVNETIKPRRHVRK